MKTAATSWGSTRRLKISRLQKRGRLDASAWRRIAVRAAIGIRIRNVKHAGQQRAKSLALHGLRRGKRKRSQRASVEASVEGDDFVAPRVVPRQLDGRLDRFGAGISEINFLRFLAGSDGRKPLGKLHHVRQIKIRAGNVNQFGGLFLNGFDNARMAMPRGDDGDARGKIQEHIAVHVLDHRAAAGFRHQRIAARVGRRNELRVPRDHCLRIRTGKRRHQDRAAWFRSLIARPQRFLHAGDPPASVRFRKGCRRSRPTVRRTARPSSNGRHTIDNASESTGRT